MNAVDTMCPVKEFKILEHRPPWYTDEIISSSRSWERQHRIGKRTKDPIKLQTANETRNKS